MAIGNRQIGWSQEDNLLWEISKQLDRMNSIVCTGPCPTTTTTSTTLPLTTTTSSSSTSTSTTSSSSSTTTTTIPPTTTTSSSSTTTTSTTLAIPNVVIGTQRWSTINLDVSTYRDGTSIPEVTDPTEWSELTTGAWCYYDNDPANGAIYGKLYNWFAVNNIINGGLAPVGQHVPTLSEFQTLQTFLGGQFVAGGKMKSTDTLWISPNVNATNESGFTGLPGGDQFFFGGFENIGYGALWWTSTEFNALRAWYMNIVRFNGDAGLGNGNKNNGFSVRCIID